MRIINIDEIKDKIRAYAKEIGLQNYYNIEVTGFKYSVTDDYKNSEQFKKDYDELPF